MVSLKVWVDLVAVGEKRRQNVHYSAVQCSTVQYSILQYSALQYNTVCYGTVRCVAVMHTCPQTRRSFHPETTRCRGHGGCDLYEEMKKA